MAVPWILSSDLVTQVILPFLLVFAVLFAVLDRIKILGEDRRQINAIVSLVIALMFVTFTKSVGMVTQLVPFMVVLAIIILVFLMLWGFLAGGKDGLVVNKGIKIAGGIIIAIAVIVAVIIVTGAGDTISGWFSGSGSNTIVSTIVFLAIVGGAIALVLSIKGK
jgi:hypothetical protein